MLEASVSDKWRILILLFLARCVMGLQFESIGALGPLLRTEGFDYRQLGILIGAYLAPGLLVALAGGVVVQKLGERSTILICLTLMATGGLLELDSGWSARLLARLLAGTGGVVLTVAATKMIVDRFSGKELATAMAIFVNSWPCGIALCLVVLPIISQSFGLSSASVAIVLSALAVLAATSIAMPKSNAPQAGLSRAMPGFSSIVAVCVAGAIWGIANAAFATIFGFGPTLLAEKGYLPAVAASRVSIVLWVTILAIPVGGMLAARQAKIGALIVVCLLIAAVLTLAVPRTDSNTALFVGIGIISGLPGAAVMSLPSRVLDAPARAIGMGIFYSVYYGIMLFFPVIQGVLARGYGSAAVTFDTAALSLLVAVPLLASFALLARKSSPPVAVTA
jgi:predicted MFS family arabinose efflux permease